MKKTGNMVLLCTLLFLLTSCGSENKLKCTLSSTDVGRKVHTAIDVGFKGKKVDSVKEKIKITFDDEYKSTVDTVYKTLKDTYKDYKKEDGITVNVSKKDTTILTEVTFDVNMQKSDDHVQNDIDINASRKEIKKQLEEKGYICK